VNGNRQERKEKGARAGPIHGPMIAMMIKLGSNRVVNFDGRLDVLNLLKNLVRRASKALVLKRLVHRVTGPFSRGCHRDRNDMGVNCMVHLRCRGKGQKPGKELVGDPQN
jgi:hypothetical protein